MTHNQGFSYNYSTEFDEGCVKYVRHRSSGFGLRVSNRGYKDSAFPLSELIEFDIINIGNRITQRYVNSSRGLASLSLKRLEKYRR